MRSTFVTFVALLVLVTAGIVGYSAIGLASGADDQDAGEAVQAFARALADSDGQAACALLSPEAQSRVEQDRKKPCEQGVVEIRDDIAPGGDIRRVDSAEKSAIVTTAEGDGVFLGDTPGGWRIDATGCERQAGDAPWDCELDS